MSLHSEFYAARTLGAQTFQSETGFSCGWWDSLWPNPVTGTSLTGGQGLSFKHPERWGHESISRASFKIILQFPSAGSLKNSFQLLFPLVYFEYLRSRFLLVPGQQNLREFLSYFQNSYLSDTFTITSEGFLDIKDRGKKGWGYFPKLCSKDKDMEQAGRLLFLHSRLLSEWKNIFPSGQSWFPYYYPIHVLWGSLEYPIVHLYASEILTSRVNFFFLNDSLYSL